MKQQNQVLVKKWEKKKRGQEKSFLDKHGA